MQTLRGNKFFHIIKAVFNFFIFSNVYISLIAVSIAWFVIGYVNKTAINDPLLYFILFGTLSSYSFHWYFTKPEEMHKGIRQQWLIAHRPVHLALLIVSSPIAIYHAYIMKSHSWMIIIAILLTAMYSAHKIPLGVFSKFKKLLFIKPLLLAFTWTFVTTIFPIAIYTGIYDGGASRLLLILHIFLFMLALCILFDIRDISIDRKQNIKTVITQASHKRTSITFYFVCTASLLAAIALAYIQNNYLQLLYLLPPTLLLIAIYKPAIHATNDYLYYLFLDGLMLLPPLLYLLLNFL